MPQQHSTDRPNYLDLDTELTALRENSAKHLGPSQMAIMADAQRELAQLDIPGHALGIGDLVPDFELPDTGGNSVSLAALRAGKPLVLAFYRGAWCPYCNLEIHALIAALPEIHAAGGRLLAISPEMPDYTRDFIKTEGIDFPILTDTGNAVAQRFGLVFNLPEVLRPIYADMGIDLPARNGDESFSLPVPATYVINVQGIVCAAHVDVDYTRRMSPATILDALRVLT